ncbi:MAG: hypothetical protein A3K19_23810 [Lentisphaerae bacterium RIFOXYB12_FULL_65_16]|nr:MAG: hypothetical protein A3K18_30650 [Lentisphaerae bacterium RIFOXYA12_64_32]OGV89616.1 MAG: hypothetical protein A3K19_23810 [Lentisphaerae bacterium RIFOXYB12_FULL_65_16]
METVLLTSGYPAAAVAAVRERWHVVEIPAQREALEVLKSMLEPPAAVAVGYTSHPGDLDARGMLQEIRVFNPDIPVIISTGRDAAAEIVDLVKRGAFDYVIEPKPASRGNPSELSRYGNALVFALSKAVQWHVTLRDNRRLRQELLNRDLPAFMRGRSRAITQVFDLIRKVAPTQATVLITGESGSGKELAARAIHERSAGKDGPFLALNCGSLTETLIASELFGYAKGAFTGADRDRAGLIRDAAGGTLFLDEVAGLPPSFQVMLLRVLEQRRARPVGDTREYAVNCRFIAAANEDLEALVRQGKFRQDLFFRLNVFAVHVPALRERRDDIPVLADFFVQEAVRAFGKPVRGIAPAALEMLEACRWPGNVRELRNAIERAVITCEGDTLEVSDFEPRLRTASAGPADVALPVRYDDAMGQFERRLLAAALAHTQGNRSEAARLLRMDRGRLNYRLRKRGVGSPQGTGFVDNPG